MKADREVRIYEEVQRFISVMATSDSHAEDRAPTTEDMQSGVGQNLFFEGFLRKRKDTMKFTWSKYWFKLQNTTLYFYTKREAQSTSLRGQYYMYSVQSVRSVNSADTDFTFEIVMKNGKRKLLSAESEDQRDVWLKLLWKSMQLPGPGRHSSSCTWYDIPELVQRGHSVSGDSDQDGQSPYSTLNDVFEQPVEPGQPADNKSDTSSDTEIYDVPRPQNDPSVSPCDPFEAHLYTSVDHLELYDSPTPRSFSDPVQEQQYLSMNSLELYDSPTTRTSNNDVSGPDDVSASAPGNWYSNLPQRGHPTSDSTDIYSSFI